MRTEAAHPFHIPTWVILLIAAVNGLIYLFLVPPWEQNDEPGQFEYVWMISHLNRVPKTGEIDQTLRREISTSMEEQGFFARRKSRPNLIKMDEPVWIGPEQIGGLPFYYQLVSYPLRMVSFLDVAHQVYYLRFLSIGFFLLTIIVSVQISREVFNSPLITALVPLTIALLPGFAHKMTAINDDVPAVFFYSMFLWMSVKVLKKGIHPLTLLGMIVSVTACLLTKRTAWSALPLGILALALSFWRQRPLLGWLAMGIFSVVIIALQFSWSQSSPAYFYYSRNAAPVYREESSMAVAGASVLKMDSIVNNVYLSIAKEKLTLAGGKTVTLGAWFWSNSEEQIRFPELFVDGKIYNNAGPIDIDEQPRLYHRTFFLPLDFKQVSLSISPQIRSDKPLYIDCVFLVMGQATNPPTSSDQNCYNMVVDGVNTENLIKNGSMEKRWPILNPEVGEWMDRNFALSIPNILAGLDKNTGFPYLRVTSNYLFTTFWERFGWGDAPLVGGFSHELFAGLTLLAILGNGILLVRETGKVNWNLILFFSVVCLLTIGMALYRAGNNWIQYSFTPVARYFFPAIFPLVAFLATGWHSILLVLFQKFKGMGHNEVLIYFSFLISYNVWAWFSVYVYYYKGEI